MAKMLALFAILVFSSLLPSPATSSTTIKGWCSHTPYPKPCEHFMSQLPPSRLPKNKSEFKKLVMEVAFEQGRHAESHTKRLGNKCRNKLEKAAWSDCLDLYDNTILQLNRTLNPTLGSTDTDTQTWLSAALTNHDTCRTGFIELGVADYMLPLMSNNVSELISNCLAINKPTPSTEEEHTSEFPRWVSVEDRKLLRASSLASKANIVVAQDGSGDFQTIKDAVSSASNKKESGRFVIYVKAGVYEENVVLGSNMKNIMFVGDGIGKTIVTGSRSVGGGSTTYSSATFAVDGDGFIAQDMTFRNTAGAANQQAVALRSASDLSVFYRCSFEGYQDTLCVFTQRQFYRECDVYGTVDFIFGNAAVVLQNCNIYVRRPLSGQETTVTAQGRTDPNQNTGISIHKSKVRAASDLKPVQGSVKSYLGRPWMQYSQTVYLQTFLGSLINPAGWLEWSGNFALNTLYYGEYKNSGPGSSTANRVKWKGYHIITNPSKASKFTVGNFISGGSWIPSTGVPFTSGL